MGPDLPNGAAIGGANRRAGVGPCPKRPRADAAPRPSPESLCSALPYPRAPTRAGGAGRLTNSISTAPEKLSAANTVKGTRYVPVVSNM